ncbi:MAG: sigma-70 family RNA polymerase sigma factor [Ruminococcaceae bacterium]|nr:sigma-70 family RNA polymerase sigma factor [Oscillospiraceae bacterium]
MTKEENATKEQETESLQNLTDREIVAMFQERNEHAIDALSAKYGRYCFKIAYNILENEEEATDCINDAWLQLWNTIPPAVPKDLRFYTVSVIRNLALNRFKYQTRKKRSGNFGTLLSEMDDFVGEIPDVFDEIQLKALMQTVNDFLHALPRQECAVFIRRYFYAESAKDIAIALHLKESNVFVILSRVRKKLKKKLQKEGFLS